MVKLPIYMDNHATTPVDPRVREAMLPYFSEDFGNAASRSHAFGWRAEAAVDAARAQIAALIGCAPNELVFTSGATESDNLAIKGVAEAYRSRGDHVITVKTEHKAVLDSCKHLERMRADRIEELRRMRLEQLAGKAVTVENLDSLSADYDLLHDDLFMRWASQPGAGARVTYLGVDGEGRIDLDQLRSEMTDSTILVSVMLANNEIGTLQPIKEIGALCRERGILFHCDAVQGLGKVPFDVEEVKADLVSITAHKMYGPKGTGALYVRRKPRVRLAPIIDGGGHERGMRSGTLNVAGIVGLGKAAELARQEMPEESERVLRLREKLRRHLFDQLDGVWLNGSLEHRLPGNLNVSFAGIDGEALMQAIRDVAVSSGAACTSASLESSYVLRACGIEEARANGSIRFGIGRFNTEEEVDYVAKLVVDSVRKLRAESPSARRGSPAPHRAEGGPAGA
ncbi:MAG TPA: IscS subfamily cysteine desulfurase [Myxococcaceae bacterium]|nr:IscS subfamily cysteine desulfurase [Myxococcaceae bacterium]